MKRSKPRHLKRRRPLSVIAELLMSVKLMAYELQWTSAVEPSVADEEQEEPKYVRQHNHPDYYGDSLGDDEGDVVIRRAAKESILAPLPDWAGQGMAEPSISLLWEIHQLPKPQEPSSEPISDPVGDSLNQAVNASEAPAQPAQDPGESRLVSPKPNKKGTKPYMIDREGYIRVRETKLHIGYAYRRLSDGQWSAYFVSRRLPNRSTTGSVYRTRAEAAEAVWAHYLSTEGTD